MNKKQFIELASNQPVQIDKYCTYKVVKMNEQEVIMNEAFKKQLIKENLYDNSYVGIIVLSEIGNPVTSMEALPIFGRKNKYETKHLKPSKELVIMTDLANKQLGILNRFNKFQEVNKFI